MVDAEGISPMITGEEEKGEAEDRVREAEMDQEEAAGFPGLK